MTSKAELWAAALGCSLFVGSLSLAVLAIVPFLHLRGRGISGVPSWLTHATAAAAVGAMLGDLLLHQLPNAYEASSHVHSRDHTTGHFVPHAFHRGHEEHAPTHEHHTGQAVALGMFGAMLLFLLLERLVGHSHSHSRSSTVDQPQPSSQHQHEVHLQAHSHSSAVDHHHQLSHPQTASHEAPAASLAFTQPGAKGCSPSPPQQPKALSVPADDDRTHLRGGLQGQELLSKQVGWLNLLADGVHNFTDGLAIGAGFVRGGWEVGFARTWAVCLHELPQELGDFSLLLACGFAPRFALLANFASALLSVLGTLAALALGEYVVAGGTHMSVLDGFTAGGFTYLSVSVLHELGQHCNSLAQMLQLIISTCVGFGGIYWSHGSGCKSPHNEL